MAKQKPLVNSLFPGGLPDLPAIASNATRTQAFTHRSLHERPLTRFEDPAEDPSPDNELLEHLGDAVLYLYVTDLLRTLYPNIRPRAATSIRAKLLDDKNLATLADQYYLGAHIRVHDAQSAFRGLDVILASTFKAYVGALYTSEDSLVKPWLYGLFTPYAHEAYSISLSQHRMDNPHEQETLSPITTTTVPPPTTTHLPSHSLDIHDTQAPDDEPSQSTSQGRAPSIPDSNTVPPEQPARITPSTQPGPRQNQPSSRGEGTTHSRQSNLNTDNTPNDTPPAAFHFTPASSQGFRFTPDPLHSAHSPPPTYTFAEPVSGNPSPKLPPLPMIKDEVMLRQVFANKTVGNGAGSLENLEERGSFILKLCLYDTLYKLYPKMALEMTVGSKLLSNFALAKISEEYKLFRDPPGSVSGQVEFTFAFASATTEELVRRFKAYVGGLSKDQSFDTVVSPWLHQLFTPSIQRAYTDYHTAPSFSFRLGLGTSFAWLAPQNRPSFETDHTDKTSTTSSRPATSVPRDHLAMLSQYATQNDVAVHWKYKVITSDSGPNWEARVLSNDICIGNGLAPKLEAAADDAARLAFEDLTKRSDQSTG